MPQNNLPVYSRGIGGPAPIVGTDGYPPIIDESQIWRRWALHDIFLGQEGSNKYVPKVNDFIEDVQTLLVYRVASIDATTLVPELVELTRSTNNDIANSEMGRFFAGGTLATPCARQIFYDDSVIRPTLTVPAQFHIQGSLPHHAIAFKGTVVGAGGIPISVRYDSSFNPVSNAIPLEPILQRDPNLRTQWFLPPFYSSERLEEGEMVLILIYDDKGGVLSRTNFVVEKSALLRDVSDADKFVSAISLESFYIDSSDESNLLIPENVLKNSINLMGKVFYTDGSSMTYPVDGSRFELLYMDRASESVVTSRGTLVLKYYLADNEKAVNAINNNNRYFITRSYQYTIIEREGSYSVKLYPIPKWVNDNIGWQLDWYLFTLDRNQFYNVTNSVYINQNSPTKRLDGKLFGPTQQLDVSIDLGTINNTFRQYIHPQQVDVRFLRNASDQTGDRWEIGFEAYQNPPYGKNLVAVLNRIAHNNNTINIANSCTTLEDFLSKVYYSTLPQYRTTREPNAPAPNMFRIISGDDSIDFPIRKWKEDLSLPFDIPNTATVLILWYTTTGDNDLYLSLSPLPVLVS